jgi:hypothetical protein
MEMSGARFRRRQSRLSSERRSRQSQILLSDATGKPNKDRPCKLSGPFHLAIDQQDRIWITNAIGDTVTRFSASGPTKVETFKGVSGKGMAVDSQANAWVITVAAASPSGWVDPALGVAPLWRIGPLLGTLRADPIRDFLNLIGG